MGRRSVALVRQFGLWGAGAFLLLATACGLPAQYRLHLGRLVPPAATAKGATVGFNAGCTLGSAMGAKWGDSAEGMEWQVSGGRLEARLYPSVERLGETMPPPLDEGVRRLRRELSEAVAQGCIPAAKKREFLSQLAESLPLSSALAQEIVLGPYGSQDYIDIASPVDLYLSYPVATAPPGNYADGYLAQTFHLVATMPDGRGLLSSGKLQVVAKTPPDPLPARPLHLPLAGTPRLVRLFLLVRCGESNACGATDHNAELVTAESQSELEQATTLLRAQPGACSNLEIAGATCQTVPLYVQLEARVRAFVNGRAVAVPLPATVGMAIETTSPGSLRVYRDYRGKLIPVLPDGGTAALMNMMLIGGEHITTGK